MESVVQLLAFILPIIAFSSVVLVLFVNLYLKIRRHFPVRVNCWFCNQWTKVHYDEQNCFECPTCLQYNGFNSDGDYNKPIPAQHDELLNQQVPVPKALNNYTSSASNGLCHLCNNNQQLKIYQLANFIPLNEANYDVEIEHFQKQLEKAYKLCPPCDSVVKTTLNKQSCLFGLKFTQLRKKGLLLLDLNSSHDGISTKTKWSFLKNLTHYTLIGFALLNLIFVLMRIDFSDRNLRKSTPKWMFVYVLKVKNVGLMALNIGQKVYEQILNSTDFNLLSRIHENVSAVGQNFIDRLSDLDIPLAGKTFSHLNSTLGNLAELAGPYYNVIPELPKVENAVLLCVIGAVLQFILLLLNDKSSFKRKLFHFAMWIVLAYMHWVYPSKEHFNGYLNAIQIVTSTTILTSMMNTRNPKSVKQKKLKRISRRARPKESSHLGELSDNEELDNFASHNSTFKSELGPNTNTAMYKCSNQLKPVFGQPAALQDQLSNRMSFYNIRSTATATKSLNQSFTSAKSRISDETSLPDTASVFSSSFINHTPPNNINLDFDIDISLNKLHLGTPKIKKTPTTKTFYTNNNISRPRPVISPPKLKNITQNSWVAGGFWRDSNGILMPLNNFPNLSRSSSQTSGFASHTGPFERNHVSSLPSSINNSFCGDFECNSVFSEPTYYMNGAYMPQGRNLNSGLACHNEVNRTFYPILNHEQLVYIAPCGFQNFPFASKISPNNKFSQGFNAGNISNLEKSSFVMPSSVSVSTNKTYKPGSLLKDWIEKMDS